MDAPPPHPMQRPLFVYGSLRDDGVLAAVLGRESGTARPVAAWLPDHRCVHVRGHSYPRLVRSPGSAVTGRLLRLGADGWRRVARFEGAQYRFGRCRVRCGDALVSAWCCRFTGSGPGGAPWEYRDWQRRHRHRFITLARTAMADFPD